MSKYTKVLDQALCAGLENVVVVGENDELKIIEEFFDNSPNGNLMKFDSEDLSDGVDVVIYLKPDVDAEYLCQEAKLTIVNETQNNKSIKRGINSAIHASANGDCILLDRTEPKLVCYTDVESLKNTLPQLSDYVPLSVVKREQNVVKEMIEEGWEDLIDSVNSGEEE